MENKAITQAEINNIVWKACDTFRGVIDPSQYKDYILTFLFIKYLGDVWKDRKDHFFKKYDGDVTRVDRALKQGRFIVPDNCTFDYLYDNRNEANIGELINIALEQLEEHNRDKLEGVFRSINFNSEAQLGETNERNERLKNLLKDFADPRLDLRPSKLKNEDIIGNAYEYLISRFASDAGKKGGEFYTPSEVAVLLAKLVNPKAGDRICDPTCGSGSLLIKVAKEIGKQNYSLSGQEVNGSTWALCKMNMFLHEMDNATIEWGNTLQNPKLKEGDELKKFDIVVANPPFSLDKWGADKANSDKYKRFWRGIPPKSKADYAFITHMIETTNAANGKAGVIVPHGVLFRASSEGKIRKQFIEENLLEAVIGLPANLFFGTGIPAAILIFNKSKTDNDVIFIDASREFVTEKTQNKLSDEHISKITDVFKKKQVIDKYSYIATYTEIKENDFNLNIPRYVDTFEEEEEINITATKQEISELENELEAVKKQMNEYLNELGF